MPTRPIFWRYGSRHHTFPLWPHAGGGRTGGPPRPGLVTRSFRVRLFLSVWAFAHEEAGDTAGAERAIDRAYEHDPTNFFAHHVKAHILEMESRPGEGNDWLAAQTGYWPIGNNLVHHLWWHRALMQLDLGERDAVLASYDANIRNLNAPLTKAAPDQFNDLQNATALFGAWSSSGWMSAAVGRSWPTRPRPASVTAPTCCCRRT